MTAPSPTAARRLGARALRHPAVAFLAVFGLALGLRLAHVGEFGRGPLSGDNIPMTDARYYDKLAREVAGGDWLGHEVYYLAPLYPYTLGIVYRLTGTVAADGSHHYPPQAARRLQGWLGALSCVLVAAIAGLCFGRAAAVLAGLAAALYGFWIYGDALLMATTQILFLHLAAILTLLVAERRRRLSWWFAAGLLLGVTVLAHGTALLVFAGAVGWVGLVLRDVRWPTRLQRIALLAAGCFPLIAGVALRNWVVGKEFVLLTSNVGKNLYIGNNPEADGSWQRHSFPEIWGSGLSHYLYDLPRVEGDLTPGQASRVLSGQAVAFVRSHPASFARLILRKLRLMFNAVEMGINDQFYYAARFSRVLRLPLVSYGMIVSLGLAGLLAASRDRRHALLAIVVAVQCASFSLVFVLARYRVVVAACLLVFAAGLLVRGWQRATRREYRWLALDGVLVALCALLAYWPVAGFTRDKGFGTQHRLTADAYRQAGDLARAEAEYRLALDGDPRPTLDPLLHQARCYFGLGEVYVARQDWQQAIDVYRRSVDLARQQELVPRDLIEPLQKRIEWLTRRAKAGGR